MTTMQFAFKKSGFKVRKPASKRWPRTKGPKSVSVDCSNSSCKNVLFVVK